MKDRNSVLLRTFIDEVQETGIFNHPVMIDILTQHKQEKLAIQSLPQDNDNNNSSLPQNHEPDTNKIVDFEQEKKGQDNSPLLENVMIVNESFTASSSTSIENKEVINLSDNPSVSHQQTSLNPSNLQPFNPSKNHYYSDDENIENQSLKPLSENKANHQDKPLPRKKDRNKVIFQNYLQYVRKTGDCEYPRLEQYLVSIGLIKQ